MATTVEATLDAIARRGILAPSECERMVKRWRKPGRPHPDDPVALARWLVINRYTTLHQADLLLAGREGELEIGQYRVVDRVLTGATEGCIEALDALGRQVIIQFVGEALAPGDPGVATFLDLARRAEAVDDPWLWRVVDRGVLSGRCYLVREAIQGETLGQSLLRGKFASPEILARMLAQVLQALHALHEAGLAAGPVTLETVALVRRSSGARALKLLFQPVPLSGRRGGAVAETREACHLLHELMARGVSAGKGDIPALLADVMNDLDSPLAGERFPNAGTAAKMLRVALAALEESRNAEPVEELEIVVVPKAEPVARASAPEPVSEPENDGLEWARPWLEKAGLSVREAACIAAGALAMILILLAALFAVGDLVPILALGLGAAGGVWTESWIRKRLAD